MVTKWSRIFSGISKTVVVAVLESIPFAQTKVQELSHRGNDVTLS
jgi:hypothetical protein